MDAEDITTAQQSALKCGTIVDGRFEILSRIGAGGMCTVYAAKHLQLDRQIALKRLHAHSVTESDVLHRFMREAKIVGTLDHENIVAMYGFGVWEEQPYIAMEYLNGRSLADHIAAAGKLSQEEAIPLFTQICDGLLHAHAHNIAHRDLKPSNIMLVGDHKAPRVKIVDFGIARVMPESGAEMQKLTQTGQVLGTVMYMSPEQCTGAKVDARSDIYSMGCLMFETLSGQPPFQGDSAFEVLGQHLGEAPPPVPGVDPALANIITWAMSKSPEARPQSVTQLKEALLNPAAADLKPATFTECRDGSAKQEPRRPKALTAIALAVAVGGVIGICAFNFNAAVDGLAEDSVSDLIAQAERNREQGSYQNALEWAEKARNLALIEQERMKPEDKPDGVHPQLAHIYSKLAEICYLQGDLVRSGNYAQNGIDSIKSERARQSHDFREIWEFRAHAYRAVGKTAAARDLFSNQLQWAKAHNDRNRIAFNELWLGQIDAAENNLKAAMPRFRRAVELSAPVGNEAPSHFHLAATMELARYLNQASDRKMKAEARTLLENIASASANNRKTNDIISQAERMLKSTAANQAGAQAPR